MGSIKKRRKAKINKHKRRKKLRLNRHKKRTWQKSVSYTHLDVYKRQAKWAGSWDMGTSSSC